MAAALPEKLSGRCAEISTLAAELSKAVDELESPSRAKEGNEVMKAGQDRVHATCRNPNSALATLQDLLSVFHELIHPLWHDACPNRDAAAIKAEIPKLKVRARLMLSTAEASGKSRAAEARALLEAVTTLEETAANDAASVLEALRIARDAYEKLAEGTTDSGTHTGAPEGGRGEDLTPFHAQTTRERQTRDSGAAGPEGGGDSTGATRPLQGVPGAIRREGAPAGFNGEEQSDRACGEDAMGGLRLTREEAAEVLRKKHQYRRLILSGRLSLPHSRAAQLVGPDCMYHLYSLQHAPETGRGRKKSARRRPTLNKSRPRS